MRIVYFLPDIDAGVSRIVINLLKFRLKTIGVEYAVVLVRRSDLTQKPVTENLYADEVIRFSYRQEENAYSVLKRLSKTLKSDTDIIVGNDGLEVKMVITEKLKNPLAYIVHGDFPSYYLLLQQYCQVINSIITYSNLIEKKVKALSGVNKDRVHKIYYPVDFDATNKPAIKNNHGIFKILFAGWLIERKGVDLLPDIYTKLIEKGIGDFELEIIGDGELMPFVKREFEKYSNVVLSGWQPQEYVRTAMQHANIFLFPSRLEGLPNVLVEALSAGCVPIVSNLESGVTDIITHQKNGLVVQKDNVSGFAEAIMLLFTNKNLLDELHANTFLSVQKFSPYNQAKAYEEKIVTATKISQTHARIFPPYIKGRILDISWLPNFIVSALRRIVRNPKL